MLSSIAESTLKQYEKPLRLWWLHCQAHNTSPFEANMPNVMIFLNEQQKTVNSYSSLNICRSAISLLMSNELGKHSDVNRYFRGIAKEKPKRARYSHTWDPSKVLDQINSWQKNESLSLEALSKKLVMLLALATAQRAQTLWMIRTKNIVYHEDRIEIAITDRIKTTDHMKELPILVLPYFKDQPNICPAKTLVYYVEKTSTLREPGEEKLLVTSRKPHSGITKDTLSRWIKTTLTECGIDTSVFKAHSTRHASVSAAARNNASIESIFKTACWSEKSSTFARFYNRPILENEFFANSVMQLNKK